MFFKYDGIHTCLLLSEEKLELKDIAKGVFKFFIGFALVYLFVALMFAM